MRKAVFLDRDGTIIEEKNYLSRVKDVMLIENAYLAIRKFNENNFLVIIITNQSGVGRGMFSEEVVIHINNYIKHEFEKMNAKIDAFYFCPHYFGSTIPLYNIKCHCRKPEPGLIIKAAKDFSIDLCKSYMIGDKISDLIAGRNAGLKNSYLINKKNQLLQIAEYIK